MQIFDSLRYFNTSGPNNPHEHYTLQREGLIKQGIKKVDRSRYFTIWAPRQTGKSTYFRLLATALRAEGYLVSHINVEGKIDSTEAFLCQYITKQMSIDLNMQISSDNIDDLFAKMCALPQKMVFIIDEIEQLNPNIFNKFFHSVRACYHHRDSHALKSVILVGVANISGIIQDNASPFNIADNFNVPYFTNEEVLELLAQHETESGQLFSQAVKEKICDITSGQPGLVNGFALELTTRYPEKPVFDYNDYLEIEDYYLYEAIDKNVSNIINKAKHEQAYMEKLLFSERPQRFDIYDERIRYLYINGVLKKNKEGNIEFGVPLYKKCLQKYFYPRMNGEAEVIQANIVTHHYITPEGKVNMDKIMRDYQSYANLRGFRYFTERDADGKPKGLREAALMYSFETYIQSFLQAVEGKSYLEAHVALGISDLIINVRGQEFVIEGKVFHNLSQFEKGKPQLAYYTQKMGLTEGVYLVFVQNNITNSYIVEGVDEINGVTITTYIVKYDLEKDFG
jgi:hypothetical protein